MNIIVYSESFLPDLGGLERNTFTLAAALQQLQHTVTVITGTLAETAEPLPFPVVRTKKVKDIVNTFSKADAIIVNGGISLKVCLPAFLLGKKYMVIYQMSSLYHRRGNGWKVALGNSTRKFFAEQALLNITVSKYAATQLQLKKSSVGVLINPVDNYLLQFAKNTDQEQGKPYDILFAGRMIRGKGIFLLVDAYELLNKKGMQLVIAFAGEGDDAAALKEYAAAKQVPVRFLGKLDKAALIQAYRAAKILIVPSSTHIEGSPLVIAESITLNTPVIASDQPAMIEIIGKAGLVFKSGDSADLAEKMNSVFGVPNALDELTGQCEQEKTKFSYDIYVTSLEAMVGKIKKRNLS